MNVWSVIKQKIKIILISYAILKHIKTKIRLYSANFKCYMMTYYSLFVLDNIFKFFILAIETTLDFKMKDAFFNVVFNYPCSNIDHFFLLKLYVRLKYIIILYYIHIILLFILLHYNIICILNMCL